MLQSSIRPKRICGELFRGLPRDQFIIQTKWYVVSNNATNIFSPVKASEKQLKQSLERMALDYDDVYIVHGQIHASSNAQVVKGLSECVKSGMAQTVGVADYAVDNMIKLADEHPEYNIPLATNQCEYHILRRLPENEDMLQACRDPEMFSRAIFPWPKDVLAENIMQTTSRPRPTASAAV